MRKETWGWVHPLGATAPVHRKQNAFQLGNMTLSYSDGAAFNLHVESSAS